MKCTCILATILIFLIPIASAQTRDHTLPPGTEIKGRTNTLIPRTPSASQQYAAPMKKDVMSSSGAVATPRGAHGENGKDTNLDLRYVTVRGRKYLLTTQGSSKNSGPGGLGGKKRTGMLVRGGPIAGCVNGKPQKLVDANEPYGIAVDSVCRGRGPNQ